MDKFEEMEKISERNLKKIQVKPVEHFREILKSGKIFVKKRTYLLNQTEHEMVNILKKFD